MKFIQYEKFSEFDSYIWLLWFMIYWERDFKKKIIGFDIGFYPDYENAKWILSYNRECGFSIYNQLKRGRDER